FAVSFKDTGGSIHNYLSLSEIQKGDYFILVDGSKEKVKARSLIAAYKEVVNVSEKLSLPDFLFFVFKLSEYVCYDAIQHSFHAFEVEGLCSQVRAKRSDRLFFPVGESVEEGGVFVFVELYYAF